MNNSCQPRTNTCVVFTARCADACLLQTRSWMSFLYPICNMANTLCDSTNWGWLCSLGQTYCMATQFQPVLAANPGINVYDITKTCDAPLCYGEAVSGRHFTCCAVPTILHVPRRIPYPHTLSNNTQDAVHLLFSTKPVTDLCMTSCCQALGNVHLLIMTHLSMCYVLPADFSAADRFLNRPDIQAALGVDDIQWRSCDRDVYMNFAGDWLHRYDTVLPDMMADGIRVMIYAGKQVSDGVFHTWMTGVHQASARRHHACASRISHKDGDSRCSVDCHA